MVDPALGEQMNERNFLMTYQEIIKDNRRRLKLLLELAVPPKYTDPVSIKKQLRLELFQQIIILDSIELLIQLEDKK